MREKELENNILDMEDHINNLKVNINEKQIEIDQLKMDKVKSIRMYKDQAVNQIENLMESLIEKDDIINVSRFLLCFKFISFYFVVNIHK